MIRFSLFFISTVLVGHLASANQCINYLTNGAGLFQKQYTEISNQKSRTLDRINEISAEIDKMALIYKWTFSAQTLKEINKALKSISSSSVERTKRTNKQKIKDIIYTNSLFNKISSSDLDQVIESYIANQYPIPFEYYLYKALYKANSSSYNIKLDNLFVELFNLGRNYIYDFKIESRYQELEAHPLVQKFSSAEELQIAINERAQLLKRMIPNDILTKVVTLAVQRENAIQYVKLGDGSLLQLGSGIPPAIESQLINQLRALIDAESFFNTTPDSKEKKDKLIRHFYAMYDENSVAIALSLFLNPTRQVQILREELRVLEKALVESTDQAYGWPRREIYPLLKD